MYGNFENCLKGGKLMKEGVKPKSGCRWQS